MNTTIIAIQNSESLYEGISTAVNEILATDAIKDSNIISNHENSFLDDSFYKVLTIKLPTFCADDEDNYLIWENIWKDLIDILFSLLRTDAPDSKNNPHLFIYNDNTTETLELHNNDETITIMYHISNQN